MFREYLIRTYQTLTQGRTRSSRRSRPATRLGIEALEDRNLLSTLTLSGGALIYAPSSGFNNTLTISDNPATHRYTFVDATENIALGGSFISPSGNHTHTASFGDGNIGSITVNMFNQEFVVNIENTLVSVPLTVNLGNGADTVDVSPTAHNLNNIGGLITVHTGLGTDSLNVFDQSNGANQDFTLAATSVARFGAAPITFGPAMKFITVNGGNGNNTYNVLGTALNGETLNTGNGHDAINVEETGSGGVFTINEGTGGDDVHLGAGAENLDHLQGTINVNGNSFGVDNLTVDDQANTGAQIFSLKSDSISRTGAGLIQYNLLNNLSVLTGTGGGQFNVLGTSAVTSIVGHATGVVNIGNAGSVQQILGPLTITDPPVGAFFTINVDDSADMTPSTVSLNTVTTGGASFGHIAGLAPAPIEYKYGDTTSVSVRTGAGAAMVSVLATGRPVDLIGNSANTTVNVGEAGSVQQIFARLTITNPIYTTTINVDDSADSTGRVVSLVDTAGTFGSITGLAPAAIQYKYVDTSSITLKTGSGGATVNVLGTGTPVNLMGNASGTVNVGNGGSVQQIVGPITITDPPGGAFVSVNVDDSADTTARFAILDTATIGGFGFGRITGLAPGAIQYRYIDTTSATIDTGTGGATLHVFATGAPVNLVGNPSAGSVTLVGHDVNNAWNLTGQNAGTLHGSQSAATLNFSNVQNLSGGPGVNTFVFADGAGVDGVIDGGGGPNTLNYSGYSSSVVVDLQTGFATGVGGITNIQNVIGGSGGGPGVFNILIGNGGNVLTGGDGRRNLLIAGGSASTLIGGNDDDILIGGTTNYDTEPGLASLQAIMAYWSSTTDDYATRVANLLSGNGVPLLDATMVTNNGGGNILVGNHGGAGEMNLFYGLDPTLEATDYNPAIGEQFVNC
jgi:hypothetical protein